VARTSSSEVLAANRWRNARGDRARRARWAPLRDEVWRVVEPLVRPGGRVAVVGAGNGHTLPLRLLASHAALTLIDVDEAALARSSRRLRVETLVHDVTEGEADRIVTREPNAPPHRGSIRFSRLPGSPYDLVIGDLLYSQLLYPALLDRRAPDLAQRLRTSGAALTRAVVTALHDSATTVLHIHDALGWWDGHTQPFTLEEAIAHPGLIAKGFGPKEADPRPWVPTIVATHHWRWPFKPGVDYLAVGTVGTR
jgi:hypothetical protein